MERILSAQRSGYPLGNVCDVASGVAANQGCNDCVHARVDLPRKSGNYLDT